MPLCQDLPQTAGFCPEEMGGTPAPMSLIVQWDHESKRKLTHYLRVVLKTSLLSQLTTPQEPLSAHGVKSRGPSRSLWPFPPPPGVFLLGSQDQLRSSLRGYTGCPLHLECSVASSLYGRLSVHHWPLPSFSLRELRGKSPTHSLVGRGVRATAAHAKKDSSLGRRLGRVSALLTPLVAL